MCTHAGQIKERELLSMALKDKGWKSDPATESQNQAIEYKHGIH